VNAKASRAARTSRRARHAAVVVHHDRPGLHRPLATLLAALESRRVKPRVYDADELESGALRRVRPGFDLVVTLGGDGTILRAARAAGGSAPILAINFGGLGFLAAAEARDLRGAVAGALDGTWGRESRRLIEIARVSPRGAGRRLGQALNDAVVRSVEPHRALRVELTLDQSDLGGLLADGLVVATPTGSSAYSLSAGGPLLLGDLPALVVTPVCPHTLASRPLVFGEKSVLTARISPRQRGATLSLDGVAPVPVGAGERLGFRLSRAAQHFLVPPGRDVARALRTKLNWHGSDSPRSL
jgi:NAD+ kinase